MAQGDAQAPTSGATTTGQSLLPGSTGGTAAGPVDYPFWSVTTDMWNLGEAASTGKVLWDRGKTEYPNTADWKDSSLSGQLSSVNKAINPMPVKGPDQVNNMRDAVAQLYTYPPDKLADIQNRMYAAGFYPPQSYAKGASLPNGKVVDDYTRAAAVNLFSTVVGYNQTKTVGEVLDPLCDLHVGNGQIHRLSWRSWHNSQILGINGDNSWFTFRRVIEITYDSVGTIRIDFEERTAATRPCIVVDDKDVA